MAAFGSLSDRLADTFDRLRGKGKLTEADINVAMREIRMALLEAGRQLPRGEGLRHAHEGALPHCRGHGVAHACAERRQDRAR